MNVTLTLASEVAKLLVRRHGSRLVGQEFWNLLVFHLGEVERAYAAHTRTPEGQQVEAEAEEEEEQP